MAHSRADYEQWKRYQEYRRENPRTFHEFIADFTLTLEEQRELVTYLAHLRYEATIKALMPCLRGDGAALSPAANQRKDRDAR